MASRPPVSQARAWAAAAFLLITRTGRGPWEASTCGPLAAPPDGCAPITGEPGEGASASGSFCLEGR